MMKKGGFGLWILFFVFGTALLFVFLSSLPPPTGDHLVHRKIITKTIRNLKEESRDENGNGNMDVNDYLPIDPVPSSKTSAVKPGPIEHGTPLMPYIPKPAPPTPNEPGYDGSPDIPKPTPPGPNEPGYDGSPDIPKPTPPAPNEPGYDGSP